jgi:c-di-GMP-binding flagellar brake protein YcgR
LPETAIAMPEDTPIPFDDLALQPGEMLQVHSALEVTGDFLPVGLLGYLKNQTLIVTNPIAAGKVVPVKEGTPYNVKGFSGTLHFTFKAKVLKVHAQPYPHMHIEYPKLVYATKIRKALRALVNLPATLYSPLTKKLTPVVLKDLSVGGGQLILQSPIGRKDGKYTLSFMIKLAEDLEEEVRTEVIVRTLDTQDARGTEVHTMGVQFLDLDKEARLLVMTFVYRQQLRKE